MEPTVRIDEYNSVVDAGADVAMRWVNEKRSFLDELGPYAYNDFVLNIKTRHLEDFLSEIQTIKEDVIAITKRNDYRTYYSAIVYNLLSSRDMTIDYLEKDVFIQLEKFLLNHKSRFLLQYAIEKCNKIDDETYEIIKNIALCVIENISSEEYYALYKTLMRFDGLKEQDIPISVVNRLIKDNIIVNSNTIEIEYQILNRTLLLKYSQMSSIVKALNNKINKLLLMRGDIKESTERVRSLNDDLLYCGFHASLTEKDIFFMLSKLYNDKRVIFKNNINLYDSVENKEETNKRFVIGNQQAAGFLTDEVGIDEKIKSLVNSLNSIPGVKTFSSCEGHYKMAFYVLWTINDNNLFKLNKIAELLSESANEAYVLYKFPFNKDPVISLYFAHDKWNASNHRNAKNLPHFEFRITMPLLTIDDKYPEMFYDFTNSISEIFATKVKEIDWTLL